MDEFGIGSRVDGVDTRGLLVLLFLAATRLLRCSVAVAVAIRVPGPGPVSVYAFRATSPPSPGVFSPFVTSLSAVCFSQLVN